MFMIFFRRPPSLQVFLFLGCPVPRPALKAAITLLTVTLGLFAAPLLYDFAAWALWQTPAGEKIFPVAKSSHVP